MFARGVLFTGSFGEPIVGALSREKASRETALRERVRYMHEGGILCEGVRLTNTSYQGRGPG